MRFTCCPGAGSCTPARRRRFGKTTRLKVSISVFKYRHFQVYCEELSTTKDTKSTKFRSYIFETFVSFALFVVDKYIRVKPEHSKGSLKSQILRKKFP